MRAALLGIILAPLASGAWIPVAAQEPPAAGGGARPEPGGIRPLGPNLFPVYDHYLRTEDSTEVRTLLFLYHATDRLDGLARTRLFLPFFYWSRQAEPPDRRLYLFPFLFFHRRSSEESFDIAGPFYISRTTPRSAFQLLFPFWWHTADLVRNVSTHRILFPLIKVESDREKPDHPVERSRFGLKGLLELHESKEEPGSSRTSALNFFNWKEETESGLSLFRHQRTRAADGIEETRSYLFPLYWSASGPDRNYRYVGPFFGHTRRSERVRRYATPFIWWAEGDGGFRSLLLFPFYHRATSDTPALSYFASYPFFDTTRTADERRRGVLGIVYRDQHQFRTGRTTRSVLYPLGYFRSDPEGIEGHRRFLPFYFDDYNDQRRFRFSFPLWWNYQTRAQRETTWDFTLVLPTYVGWGAPRDYFATGFPLYWGGRTGARGWDLFIPLYYRRNDATSSQLYSLPFSRVSLPSQKATSILAGAATHRRFQDLQGNPQGWSLDLLWWLWGFGGRPDGAEVRLLPLFWWERQGEDRSLLLFPLWYGQWGPSQTQSYFFPIYGRFVGKEGLLRRDLYGLGTYIRTREKDQTGAEVRSRDDILWSLISSQENRLTRSRHRRILPLLYWQTDGVSEDRTLAGPFWYSHRIHAEDQTHRLKLILGNLFYWRTVHRDPDPPAPAPAPATPPPTPAPGAPPSGEGAPAGEGAPPSGEGAPPSGEGGGSAEEVAPRLEPALGELVEEEKGVLWPLSRWGKDSHGNPYRWVLPFYYQSRTPTEENLQVFPLAYFKNEKGGYRTGYFRYFYLFDREKFEGGHRISVGQLLFDWFSNDTTRERRGRFLYPIFETSWSPEGFTYQITPLWQGSRKEAGGELITRHALFPIWFQGSTRLKRPDGGYNTDARHFYLFPLYGVSQKSLRTERDFLIPFFHYRDSLDGFAFALRPIFFLRREPEETSVRLWPIHSQESGEGSGEWWVSRFLFFSKLAVRRQSFSYRLDPLLFHARSSPTETSVAGPFHIARYRQTREESGPRTRWHALPLAYGYANAEESGTGIFPLRYARDFGEKPIDHAAPGRFFFLLNRLRGAGEDHWSLLWKLAEFTRRPGQEDFHDFRILQEVVVDRKTPSSRQITVNPFFSYVRDDGNRLLDWSLLFSLYRYKRVQGIPQHTVFWIFRWTSI